MANRIYSVVAIVINTDGRFLAVSRKDDHADLGWPGGKIEPGETPEDAAVRELREEAALIVSRRALRSSFIGPDEAGRLCMAFDVAQYKGIAYSREGAWVGWVEPARLVEEHCTFREYSRALFEHKGISVAPPSPVARPALPIPSPPVPLQPEPTVEDALRELTGVHGFPRGHITFLYGAEAFGLCPTPRIAQPRFTFDQRDFSALTTVPVLGIETHLQRSVVPDNLLRLIQSLGTRCTAAVVAASQHRPPADWQAVSSNIIECQGLASSDIKLTLTKNLASSAKPVGSSVVVPKPKSLETTPGHSPTPAVG